MTWRQIDRRDWKAFLTGFSSEHRGWLVTIETRERTTAMKPLVELRFEDDRVAVTVGEETLETFTIEAPTEIRLNETAEHAHRSLVIESDGALLRLRFRVAIPSEMVDG